MQLETNVLNVLKIIYDYNARNEPIWYTKLCEVTKEQFQYEKNEVSGITDFLGDFFYIKGAYGDTENGRAGYRYYITETGELALMVHGIIEKGKYLHEIGGDTPPIDLYFIDIKKGLMSHEKIF